MATTAGVNFGPKPQTLICPHCHASVKTKTSSVAASKTHLWALCLCLCLCWLCCCIPYCCDSCQNITHYCPNCNAYLGGYNY